jgi:hypothetical protein
MTRTAFEALPQNHKKFIHGIPWAIVADDGVSFVPVKLDTPYYTRCISFEGDTFIIDYGAGRPDSFGVRLPISRMAVKNLGGTIVKEVYCGEEKHEYLYQDSSGKFWYGDDWYNDSTAICYPTYPGIF